MAFKYRKRSSESVQKRAEQQGGDFQGFIKDEFKLYRPKKGDNWVRILPPTWEDTEAYGDHYGIEVQTHYGIGPDRASVLCCHKMPDPETGRTSKCPICAAKAKLDAAGDEEEAKELRSTKRVLVWVLDRNDPAKGPLVWGMPWSLDRDIAKVSIDKRSGKTYFIDHPEEGYDVTFEVEGEKRTTKYTGVQIARKRSAVDPEDLEFVEANPLPDVLLYRSAKEIQALYEGTGDDDEAPKKARRRADDDDEDDAPPARKAKARRPDPEEEEEEDEPPPRKKVTRRPDPEDDEEDEPPPRKKVTRRPDPEDEEEEDEPPRRKASRRPADDEEEEEEEAPPPRKKAARRPDPEDEEEEDEDDAPPPRKVTTKAKAAPAARPKLKAPAEDEDEEEENDDGAAAARAKRLNKKFGPR